MTTACANCPSNAALGTEAASICAECSTLVVGGASISLPVLLAVAGGAFLVLASWNAIGRLMARRSPRVALG